MKNACMVLACCLLVVSTYAEKTIQSFAGPYYRGDGLGYNVTLNLKEDGHYEAWWDGCLGRYGTAKGTWAVKDAKLILNPTDERAAMKGHLRVLLIRKYDDRVELLPEEDDRRMKSEEEKRTFSFSKVEKE